MKQLIDMRRIEDIAQVAHEANRAYCATLGDFTQPTWEEAPMWQRQSAVRGVCFLLRNPVAYGIDVHEHWMRAKEDEGWVYGEVKDPEQKTHPCMVPYRELPMEQRRKDAIFVAVVRALQ